MPVLLGAEPFNHVGRDVAVVLCHGFTGTPQSLRGWAERLAAEGFTVRLPRLPGHGTSWQELNRTRWPDWYAAVEAQLLAVADDHETVVVGGLSMGGALSLRLAEQHPALVHGLVLVNPAIKLTDRRLLTVPVLRHLLPSTPGIASDIRKPNTTELAYDRTPLQALHSSIRLYAEVERALPQVSQPLLMLRSAVDHVVPVSSAALVLDRISSSDVTDVVLHDSYHVATLDEDAEVIVSRSIEFVHRVAGERAATAAAGDSGQVLS